MKRKARFHSEIVESMSNPGRFYLLNQWVDGGAISCDTNNEEGYTEEEAIAIANDSLYGLSGGVWAGTPEKAFEVARKIRTGQVEVNGGGFNIFAPFGGYKQSGIGRELGKYGFEEFLEVKAIQK